MADTFAFVFGVILVPYAVRLHIYAQRKAQEPEKDTFIETLPLVSAEVLATAVVVMATIEILLGIGVI